MEKIIFVMPSLGTGGAERVVSTILKYLNKEKYHLSLILLREEGDYVYDLPEEIEIISLNSKRSRFAIKDLIRNINKIQPDIIFSSLRGVSVIISFIRPFIPSKTKIIFREENTASISIKNSNRSLFFNLYYRTLYPLADKIICQSDYMKNDLSSEYNIDKSKLKRIYNPVDFQMIKAKLKNAENPFRDNSKKNVIVVGRMSEQKGIDILLKSMNKHKIQLETLNVLVHFIGDGKLLKYYKQMSLDLGLDNYVKFMGRQENPFQWMYYADLFILPSRYEGLPNSLLEASACNCETITTNHPGGTREIMKIIDKEENITNNLKWESTWFQKDQSSINIKNLKEMFNVDTIIQEYEKIFDEL